MASISYRLRHRSSFLPEMKILAPLVIVLAYCFVALAAPLLAPHDPLALDSSKRLLPPSGVYLLGTDDQGRDVLSRLIYGIRLSMAVGIVTVTASAIVGVAMGLASASSKWLAPIFMRFTDGLMAFPAIIFAIALIAAFGRGPDKMVLAMIVIFAPLFTRVTYGEGMSVLRRDFVEGARVIGCGPIRLLVRHVLPNLLPVLIVQCTYVFSHAIVVEASLSFVGAGIEPPAPSLGAAIEASVIYMRIAWWMLWPAIGVLTALILALSFLGDALQSRLQRHL
jgi:peptide/nickel transport system permease protein